MVVLCEYDRQDIMIAGVGKKLEKEKNKSGEKRRYSCGLRLSYLAILEYITPSSVILVPMVEYLCYIRGRVKQSVECVYAI